jgi:hypothetical protein
MRFLTVLLTLAISFVLTACGGGAAPAPPTYQKPAAEVVGKTTPEKAFSIASLVSQKYKGLLVVSDARILTGLNVVLIDGATQRVQGNEPIWLLNGDAEPDAASSMRGLVFKVHVIKSTALYTEQDDSIVQSALANLFALSAKTFFQGSNKEFSFIEMDVEGSSFDTYIFHAPVKDILAERDKGADIDWETFVASHGMRVQQALLFVIPPKSNSSSPQPKS